MIGNPVAKWPYGIAPKLGDLYATHTHKRKGGHVRICRIEGDALLHIYAWLECHLRWRRSSIQPRRCYSGRAERRIRTRVGLADRLDDHALNVRFWARPSAGIRAVAVPLAWPERCSLPSVSDW